MTNNMTKHNSNTISSLFYGFALMAVMSVKLLSATPAHAVSLKAESLITGDHITVGDVFSGIKKHADFVLAPAPRPGQDLIWNASTLNRIARAFDLPWTPDNGLTQLKIRRLATVIPAHSIKSELQKSLLDKGLEKDSYELSIKNLAEDSVILPHGASSDFRLDNINFDPAQRLIQANLIWPAQGVAQKTIPLHAYVIDVERLPVLNKRMRRGEIIKASDIDYLTVRSESIPHDAILNAEELIGTTPRTSLNSTSPIRSFDLQMPKIVKRGEVVTMVFQNGRIYVETMGKALEDGAKGDVIRVANGSSLKTVQAIITGERKVKIQ